MGEKNKISKRHFLKTGLLGAGGFFILDKASAIKKTYRYLKEFEELDLWKWSTEAFYYTETPRGLKCLLCPQACVITEDDPGFCNNLF